MYEQYLPSFTRRWIDRRIRRYLRRERFKREVRWVCGEVEYEALLERERVERNTVIVGWVMLAGVAMVVLTLWFNPWIGTEAVAFLERLYGLLTEAAFFFVSLA
jgi:hypothetical protein